jgi:sulfide:quinone oxidoreductase
VSHRIVILGGGTGGTLAANRLAKMYKDQAQITVVDRDDRHIYQPGLLFVPFGYADPDKLVKSRRAQLNSSVELRLDEVDRVEIAENAVHLHSGAKLSYDVLIVASGVYIFPEELEGLTGPGWMSNMFPFYTVEGATALRDALKRLDRGRLVLNVVDMPIKCPVAPIEFCFLADYYLHQRGVRDKVEVIYATPLDGAFTKPIASQRFGDLLTKRGVKLETGFAAGKADGEAGKLISFDGREVDFDLLVSIPTHGGAPFVGRSPGLGDDSNFVTTDKSTLQSKAAPNVFAIGDAANLPTSKAGSVTHFASETLVENVHRFLDGKPLAQTFDGHSNCFIETGFKKALLIDFNYDYEPVPGKFPMPRLGPLPLLKESRLNHLGKLAFEWVYWNMLLPGREMPLVHSQMSLEGKDLSAIATPAQAPAGAPR